MGVNVRTMEYCPSIHDLSQVFSLKAREQNLKRQMQSAVVQNKNRRGLWPCKQWFVEFTILMGQSKNDNDR